jgi:hypothetical protein
MEKLLDNQNVTQTDGIPLTTENRILNALKVNYWTQQTRKATG